MEDLQIAPAGQGSSAAGSSSAIQDPVIPRLELDMQSMSISSTEEEEQEEIHQYSLYMKLATTQGSPRILSLDIIKKQMQRAWRANFGDITQVHQFVFKASFQSFNAMMWVFKRQPWLMGQNALLFEFADSNGDSFQREQQKSLATGNQLKYTFKFIYVTVRVYGVPWKCRSLPLLADILRMIGTPSELHELKDIMIYSHQDYIWGVIKHDILAPVVDRIKLGSTNGSDNLVYVHYEKIGRICLFCGVMFHIAGNCFMRQRLVTHRMKAKESAQEIPFQRYGQWIIDEKKIPAVRRVEPPMLNQAPRVQQSSKIATSNSLIMAAQETLNLPDEEAITNAMKKMEMSRGKSQRSQELVPAKNKEPIQSSTVAVVAGSQHTHSAPTTLAMQDAHVPNSLPAWEARGKSIQCNPGEGDGSRQHTLRREQPVIADRTVQSMELDLVPARLEGGPHADADKMPYTATEERAILQEARSSHVVGHPQNPSPASG
jgi:hypothetical protein